jgi:sugar/nucleoside kinase (ribokinase family)
VQVIANGATCVSVGIFRTDGERLFVTYPGVLDRLGEYLANVTPPTADVAFFSGWCQPPRVDPAILTRLFALLAKSGTPIAFDLSWHDETWRNKQLLREVLEQTDFVLLNRDELAALVDNRPTDAALDALATELGERPTIVVKAGANGALAKHGGNAIVQVMVPALSTASAVGAGDAFNAAFLAATFGEHQNLTTAIARACNFATAAMRTGRNSGPPRNLKSSWSSGS